MTATAENASAPAPAEGNPAASSPTPAVASSKKRKASKPTKAPKAAKAAKVPSSHPVYGDMIKKAITELKEHKGSSRAAILKYILQHYKVGDNIIKVIVFG